MIRKSEFRLGSHTIRPAVDEIGTERIESKAMEVLLALVNAAPDPITPKELLEQVWPDTVVVDNVVHKAVAHLRRALGDDAQKPKYIETIPRRGYRLIAHVGKPADSFFAELRRRKVVQSAAIYGAVAWGVTEVLVTIVEQLFLPQWVSTLTVIFFVVGFPVAMFLAWRAIGWPAPAISAALGFGAYRLARLRS